MYSVGSDPYYEYDKDSTITKIQPAFMATHVTVWLITVCKQSSLSTTKHSNSGERTPSLMVVGWTYVRLNFF